MSYFPQSHPEFNYLRHLLLLYGDAARSWTQAQLRHAAAHLDPAGRADDWLFDSFLFLNVKASSGRDYCADVNLGTTMCGEGDFFAMCSPRPANREDWEALLDSYLGPAGAVRKLDDTIGELTREIGRPYGHRRNVVLMLPYPHITQGAWGRLAGAADLDFTIERHSLARATEQRLEAATWFVDEVVRRAAVQRFAHVHLLGVYWMFESVHRAWNVDDHWLLKSLRPRIHRYGLKFVWIPFWSTYNLHLLDDYHSYYFDLAFLQPNRMFYGDPGKNIPAAARAARRRRAGLEMEYYLELDEPIGVGAERHQRFREYLDGGVVHGYMRESACAHFQGVGALERMHAHADPVERAFYDDIYHFVKGDYVARTASAPPHAAAARGRIALAIDLGGTNLRAALVDDRGTVICRRVVPTPSGGQAILSAVLDLASWALADADARGWVPEGIGVSTGGRVDHQRGVVVESTASLDGWSGVALASELRRHTGLPAWVDNDGHCAALAERRFGAGGVPDFLAVIVGTGIGGGIVQGGELVRGARNAAGEVGHIPVALDGPRCGCGSRGCVETYASGSGLAALAREWMRAGTLRIEGCEPEAVDTSRLGQAASSGNDAARALIQQGGRALGTALAGLINVLNPSRVILSGPVLQLGTSYVDAVRAAIAERAVTTARESCEVVVSPLTEPALLGAAALVFGD